MNRFLTIIFLLINLSSCDYKPNSENLNTHNTITQTDTINHEAGYSMVNGIKMYYEIHGSGEPLVLIHGGGSTIETTFGRILHKLALHRKVIGVELQAHGHSGDRDAPLSFEQDADDVAALLKNLKIPKADFFGFSNGGNTTMQIAIRHPEIVNKIIVASAFYKRNGIPPQFWDFMSHADLSNMPGELKEAYKKVALDSNHLQIMHDKCAARMVNFKDWPDATLKSIKAPTLLIAGDNDVMTPEHIVEMHRLIPHSEMAIIPGTHGEYIGEITTLSQEGRDVEAIIPLVEDFLDKPFNPSKK